MKQIEIDKQILCKENVLDVKPLDLNDDFHYTNEEDGIRTTGTLTITGSYQSKEGIEQVHEILQMDIFAPKEKLTDEPFYIQIHQHDVAYQDTCITIHICFDVFGMIDEQVKQELEEKEYDVQEGLDDLFADADTTYTSYRLVVANKNDTYEQIAQRYHVDCKKLEDCNCHKELKAKTLIILPE